MELERRNLPAASALGFPCCTDLPLPPYHHRLRFLHLANISGLKTPHSRIDCGNHLIVIFATDVEVESRQGDIVLAVPLGADDNLRIAE